MLRKFYLVSLLSLALFATANLRALPGNSTEAVTAAPPVADPIGAFSPKFGIVVKASTLGGGGDVGVSLARLITIRGGFNGLSFNKGFTNSGVQYDGTLHLRSGEVIVDITPLGDWFHVSPGMLVYNDNRLNATAMVPGGQNFDLNNVSFRSSPADPIHGTGQLTVNKTAPMIMFGFGNPIPLHHHFTIFQDIGVAYQGTPKTVLNFAGTACDAVTGLACVNAATDPTFQTQLQAEQTKINKDTSIAKYYPIFTVGLGFRF